MLVVLGACATYDGRYVYEPAIVSATLHRAADDAPVARTAVSVVGVRNADSDTRRPREVEVRLRVENVGAEESLQFRADELTLVTADLSEIRADRVEPPVGRDLAPGESVRVTAYFPLAAEALDPHGLAVRWTLASGGRRFTGSSEFQARRDLGWYGYAGYYGPYYGGYGPYYGGYHGYPYYCW